VWNVSREGNVGQVSNLPSGWQVGNLPHGFCCLFSFGRDEKKAGSRNVKPKTVAQSALSL
jgi:hypothetical protein